MSQENITTDELLAQRYVDGLLVGEEKEALERRLGAEPELAATVEGLRATRSWFKANEAEGTVPPGFASRVAFMARNQGNGAEGMGVLLRKSSWAAALLLLLGIGSMALLNLSQGGDDISASGVEQQYEILLQNARENEAIRRQLLKETKSNRPKKKEPKKKNRPKLPGGK